MEIIDEDGRRRRLRRIPRKRASENDTMRNAQTDTVNGKEDEDGGRASRECPVPKPGGFFGQLLGFKQENITRPLVRIEPSRPEGRERSGEGG